MNLYPTGLFFGIKTTGLRVGMICLIFFCLGLHAKAAGLNNSWWNSNWRYRNKILVDSPPVTLASNVAYVRFSIPEGCHPEGKDVRIVDDTGRLCPMKLMFFEPALYGVVAFDYDRNKDHYWLYMGNPDPGRQALEWEPRAGVFLETWRRTGNRIDSWEDFEQMLNESRHAYGAGYLDDPRIQHAYNLFGPMGDYLSIYTAYLQIQKSGEYDFCTASDDASFLWIDDTLVVQWPGHHGASGGLRGEHQGSIRLEQGVYRLRYVHVDFGDGNPLALAAWRPHGQFKFKIIEKDDFVPICRGILLELQEYNKPITIDFKGEQLEYLKWNKNIFTAYQFTDRSIVSNGRIQKRRWKFSDGVSIETHRFNRVFFSTGDFTITLEVEDNQGRTAASTRTFRVHPIDDENPADLGFLAESFGKLAASMPIDQLDNVDLRAAAEFLYDQGEVEAALTACQKYLERLWNQNREIDVDLILATAKMLGEKANEADNAVSFCRTQLVRLPADHPARASLLFILGRLQFEAFGESGQSLVSLDQARDLLIALNTDRSVLRQIWILRGDVCRFLGRVDQAREAYVAAEAIQTGEKNREYDMVSCGLMVESYMRQDRLDEAEETMTRWLDLFPHEKLTGYASLLIARLRLARKDRNGALTELETVLKCDPAPQYVREILEFAGDLYAQMQQQEKARASYQKILDEYDVQPEKGKSLEEKMRIISSGQVLQRGF